MIAQKKQSVRPEKSGTECQFSSLGFIRDELSDCCFIRKRKIWLTESAVEDFILGFSRAECHGLLESGGGFLHHSGCRQQHHEIPPDGDFAPPILMLGQNSVLRLR